MIDLSIAASGELGKDVYFSDLYAAATLTRFTGAILVRAPKEQAIFFRGGAPVHTSGPGFESDHLGELLVRDGVCTREALDAALDKQERAQGQRPLLGLLLVADAGVQREAIKRSMLAQTEARTFAMFSISSGTWQSAPGENARLKEIGVPLTANNLLLKGLKDHASDDELRAVSDALLGRAVQLSGPLPELGLDDTDRQVLKYLDKPRKPDQLERAANRRLVRTLLRLLTLLDKLKLSPAPQAIPIPKATRIAGSTPASGTATADLTSDPTPTPSRSPTPSPKPRVDAALISEVRALHGTLADKTHFEILGISEASSTAEVRKAFTVLQKKFHPDAFVGVSDEELLRLVREISARMNEAYNTISNEKTRSEYVALLASRFKGDARKAERGRDAEVKHQMGLVMLKKREYQKAREYFNFAMQSDPENGEYKASMAWAIFADPKTERQEAKTTSYALLLEALKSNPSATTHYYAGQVLKARDQTDEALFHFMRAAKLDPKHADAQREVRLISGRKGKDKDKDSLLDKIFKR